MVTEEGARRGGGSAASNATSGRDERKQSPGRQAREMDRAKDCLRRRRKEEEDQEEDVSMGGSGPRMGED